MTDHAAARGAATEHAGQGHAGQGHAGQDHAGGQQHPIGLYLKVWGLLFVLSAFSYLVDYFGVTGYARWSLIVLFMLLKAGLIVSVFMHMRWERLALRCAILVPPAALLVFVAMMALEADYTFLTRVLFLGSRS
jgi:cytochrome c oxidase subunit IV